MLSWLGHYIFRHRRLPTVTWVLFPAVGAVFAPQMPSLPVVLFCVLFGLTMDYEVFLPARVKEHYTETGDDTASVALGLVPAGSSPAPLSSWP